MSFWSFLFSFIYDIFGFERPINSMEASLLLFVLSCVAFFTVVLIIRFISHIKSAVLFGG